jgi:hypothetical protein
MDFVTRTRFINAFPTSLSPATFVDSLFANAGVTPSASERTAAINEFGGAGNTADTAARARALRRIADKHSVCGSGIQSCLRTHAVLWLLAAESQRSSGQNLDFSGYNFWLNKLNQFGGNLLTQKCGESVLLLRANTAIVSDVNSRLVAA